MSTRTLPPSTPKPQHYRLASRIENDKSLLNLIKKGERTFSILSLHCESTSKSSLRKMLKKTSRFFHRIKHCDSISADKDFVSTATLISKTLNSIQKCTAVRKLRLICQNQTIDNRVSSYRTLKPLKKLNRLRAIQLNIFFNLAKRTLFSKFGSLIQSMRVKQLSIKEPLTLAADRLIRRFYIRAKRTSPGLQSLAITDFTPMEGLIERYIPFRLARRADYLRELHLNLIGVSLYNNSFESLLVLIKGMSCLNKLNLDVSFNKITHLNDLQHLNEVPLSHIHLNFSHCPLSEGSISQIARLVKTRQKLTSVEIILQAVEIKQPEAYELSESLACVKNLTDVNISLSNTNCMDVRNLWRFFNQFLIAPSLRKLNLNLSQALCMGLHPEIKAVPLNSVSLKFLNLNLNHNNIRNTEMAHVISYFENCVNIERLRLSFDGCRLSGRAGDVLCKWISSLGQLKEFDISLKFAEISESCLSDLSRRLAKLNLQELKMDLTDTFESIYLAKDIWEAILTMKKVKYVKIVSSYVGLGIPSNPCEILKSKLPRCVNCDICQS